MKYTLGPLEKEAYSLRWEIGYGFLGHHDNYKASFKIDELNKAIKILNEAMRPKGITP